MKYLYLLAFIFVYWGFYIGSFLAFLQGVDVIAYPLVIGTGFIIGAMTYEYLKEYWI